MNTFKNIILFYFLINLVNNVCSSRILAVFPFNGKSHDMMFNTLLIGLEKRNHQVDVITHFPAKNPPSNYTVIINLNGTLPPTMNSFTFDFVKDLDSVKSIASVQGNRLCQLLGLEEMQRLIRNPPTDPPYDVVITEAFGANCFMGLGHVFKVPVIAVTTSMEFPWVADFTGNIDNLAFVPSYFTENFDKSKFLHRLFNFISHHWNKYKFHKVTEETQTNLMRKYLSADLPNIRDVEKNIALLLINRHPIVNGLKPISSSLIEVSGLHLEETDFQKLSPELEKWLDESKDGVVYFSFGSMVLIETLPTEIIQAAYKSFAKIAPVRVLMKVCDESKLPPGKPKNVKILSWIPQRALLAHKNTRAYLSHGGLMGSQEALYYGVPIIGIPLFSDQPLNVDQFVAINVAIKIDKNNITTSSLDEALDGILNDPKYRDNMKRYSKLFIDRPMKPMDTAVYWIEYVIRNGNVLKSPAFELTWWQLYLFDVYACILIALIIVFAFIYYVTNYLTKIGLMLLLHIFVLKRIQKDKVQ